MKRTRAFAGIVFALIVMMLAVWGAPSQERASAAEGSWTGRYWDNPDLAGTPVLKRDDGYWLDFFWDGVSPGPGVPDEGWSARWNRSDWYEAGEYRFTVTVDDGVYLQVDGVGILDEWFDQSVTTYVVDYDLTEGIHQLRVDYYNNAFEGWIEVEVELLQAAEPAIPTDTPEAPPPEPSPVDTATPAPPAASPSAPAPAPTSAATGTARAPSSPTRGPRASTPSASDTASSAFAPPVTATPTAVPSTLPPDVGCAWQLPDMDSLAAGMQYTDAGGGHDDDPLTYPDADGNAANGVQPACALAAGLPAQPEGVLHMVQTAPNLDNLPEERRIEVWLAATHAEGIDRIAGAFFAVYDPQGTQVATIAAASACDAAGSPMFGAATGTGQVDGSAVGDPGGGLAALCLAGGAVLFRGELLLSNADACGEYKAVGVAMNGAGYADSVSFKFDVVCLVALRIDFQTIDWGALTPGVPVVIEGDATFLVEAEGKPTLRNAGNDGAEVAVRFSPLVGQVLGERIETFAVCITPLGRGGDCRSTDGDGMVSFAGSAPSILCAAAPAAANFVVMPPDGVSADQYRGAVEIVGSHRAGRCFGALYLP
ncbi:MAG: hypothetical protein HY873_06380 [Chloroflexi bacterium]|nr:hypothetical protein [Chloroflexota bacterium]